MKLEKSWFTDQLDLVAQEVSTWSEWERQEGGLAPSNVPVSTSSVEIDKTTTPPIQPVHELVPSS
jgi:hypothetical protein